jgi:hypothetical protein
VVSFQAFFSIPFRPLMVTKAGVHEQVVSEFEKRPSELCLRGTTQLK